MTEVINTEDLLPEGWLLPNTPVSTTEVTEATMNNAQIGSIIDFRNESRYVRCSLSQWRRYQYGELDAIPLRQHGRMLDRLRHHTYHWVTYIPIRTVESYEEMESLPVGSIIEGASTLEYNSQFLGLWRKVDAQSEGLVWQHLTDHAERGYRNSHIFVTGSTRLLFTPEPVETEALAQLNVGDRITSAEQLDSLPVGARVQNSACHFTKREDHHWTCRCGTRYDDSTGVVRQRGGDLTVESLPDAEVNVVNEVNVGDITDTIEKIRALPVGSRTRFLNDGGRTCWEKIEPNLWVRTPVNEAVPRLSGERQADAFIISTIRTVLRVGPVEALVEEACTLTVGQEIDRLEDFTALPVGSQVRYSGQTGAHLEKTAPNQWQVRRPNGGDLRVTRYSDGQVVANRAIIRVGPDVTEIEPAEPVFTVGQRINYDSGDFSELPTGTVLICYDTTYTKNGPDSWTQDNRGLLWNDEHFTSDSNVIHSLPENPHFTVGEPVNCRLAHFSELPIGSVITWDGYTFTKEVANSWRRSGKGHRSATQPDSFFTDREANILTRIGPAEAVVEDTTLEARIEEAKQEIRDAINECVNNQGNWGWVRDGAFMQLGIDPVPEVGEHVIWGSAFGMPVGTVLRFDGRLYEVKNNDEPYPELTHGVMATRRRDDRMEILFRGEYTAPVYTGRNNLIHRVWEKERLLREQHSWCEAVEYCLEQHGLDDPGDVPDEPVTPPVVMPAIGQQLNVRTDQARLAVLPNGTTFTTTTGVMVIKADDRVLLASNLRPFGDTGSLTVSHIPNVPDPWGEEPF